VTLRMAFINYEWNWLLGMTLMNYEWNWFLWKTLVNHELHWCIINDIDELRITLITFEWHSKKNDNVAWIRMNHGLHNTFTIDNKSWMISVNHES
jgi:hypothetical protein